MDNLLFYLLEVSVGQILFYLCYILFFSRDTFYLRNRILLLGILLFSVIIPVVKAFNISKVNVPADTINVVTGIIHSGAVIGATVSDKIASFDMNNLIVIIYFSVSGVFLLRAMISIIRTLLIIRKGTTVECGFPGVVISDFDHPAFSFFPFIVIPKRLYESGDFSDILTHEKAHIKQGHTFDLLLAELFVSFLWFNPAMWFIRRSIVLNHEYLADDSTVKELTDIKEYQYKLLRSPISLMNVPLAHNFSSLIKNRIVMINKRPTQNYALLKNIFILPVLAVVFMIFSFRPDSQVKNTGHQESLFSQSSESEILKFLASSTGYPQEARNSSDTGRIFLIVKMNKGGIVQECKAYTEKNKINVPFLHEIVIVGYKPSAGQDATASRKSALPGHPELKAECLRITNKLGELKIPEWKDKNMEFAIAYKFVLK